MAVGEVQMLFIHKIPASGLEGGAHLKGGREIEGGRCCCPKCKSNILSLILCLVQLCIPDSSGEATEQCSFSTMYLLFQPLCKVWELLKFAQLMTLHLLNLSKLSFFFFELFFAICTLHPKSSGHKQDFFSSYEVIFSTITFQTWTGKCNIPLPPKCVAIQLTILLSTRISLFQYLCMVESGQASVLGGQILVLPNCMTHLALLLFWED